MSQMTLNANVINTTTNTKARSKRKTSLPFVYKFVLVFTFISIITSLFSTLFIRSYNINLSMEQQTIDSKISTLQVENDAIRVEIQSLNSRERVANIASDAGLTLNQSNIVTVDGQ